MNKGIVKVTKEINKIPKFSSISFIGDPGCDGLGASTMSVFAKALTCQKTDFSIVLGDIVHRSITNLYASVIDFVNIVSQRPVYLLCGNHDTIHYDEHFGLRNYLLYNDKALFLFLDNSKRKFEENTLNFIKSNISKFKRKNIVILFHVPPPSAIGENTVKQEEWDKVKEIILPFKENIRYIICGHVHSYYEDKIEGTNLLVSGGGGAKIEFLNPKIDKQKAHHHIVKLYFNTEDILVHEHISLESFKYIKELEDKNTLNYLENAFTNESKAHIKYMLFAEEAEEKGFPGIAKLFRALSDSEYYHAKNHYYVLGNMDTILNNLSSARDGESFEINVMYKEYLDYCRKSKKGLSAYAFLDSLEAEKIHYKLISEALKSFLEGKNVEIVSYHTCTSCGYTFSGISSQVCCPVCGAPFDRIKEVK